jgi:hypothetical protein
MKPSRWFTRPVLSHLRIAVAGTLITAAIAMAFAGTAGAAKSAGSKIDVKGGSYTVATSPVGGVVLGRVEFNVDATSRDGRVSGSLAVRNFGCLTDGAFDPSCSGPDKTLYQVGFDDVEIDCLVGDATTRTVWFSGRTLQGDDQRLPEELRLQEHGIIAQGNEIVLGRFQDVNGDGSADLRSLFLSMATTPYPNALTEDGAIGSPWYLQRNADLVGGSLNAANACLARNAMYVNADYEVVHGHRPNTVQWLSGDGRPLGSPITGTAVNLAYPPSAALYDLSGVTRILQSDNLSLSIK